MGDYVYQITRDAYGNFQQNVYGYVADPLNPSTDAQVCARAAMACVERAMFSYYDFIFNAFQGKQAGVESINEFSRINYRAIRDEFDAWYDVPEFNEPIYDYPLKGNTMPKAGNFNLSYGTLKGNFSFAHGLYENKPVLFQMYEWINAPGQTLGDFMSRHNFKEGDIVDFMIIVYGKRPSDNFVGHFQFSFKKGQNPRTILTSSNWKSLFGYQSNVRLNANYYNEVGNFSIQYEVPDNSIYTTCQGYACKVSRYENYMWKFSDTWIEQRNAVYFGNAGYRTPYEVFNKWKNV